MECAERGAAELQEQDLLAFLRTYLNDPTQVRDTGVTQPALKRAGPGDRYVACVRYNSRDDFIKSRYGEERIDS